MKGRGKAVETYNGNNFSEFNYSGSDLPCQKHPFSSSVGICAYCLKDRLINLVCSECGEKRLSSCSCSEIPPHSIPSGIVNVGSVGRMSFLIEKEKTGRLFWHRKSRKGGEGLSEGETIMLKRSSSNHVEVNRSRGFSKIRKLFGKKKEKGVVEFDNKSDFYVSDCMGVSRSRSLCSFGGGGRGAFKDPEEEERSDFSFSSGKISDFNGGFVLKSEKKHSFIEAENVLHHKVVKKAGIMDIDNSSSVIPNSSVFPVKENDILGMGDSAFIDLKLDLSSESNPEFSAPKMSDLSDSDLKQNGIIFKGGACSITFNSDTDIKRGTKGQKVWKWILRHHRGRRSAASQRDNEDSILKS